jgi:hypothetical protein
MPDNWGYVFAAYGLAVLVLGGYWRRLARRERELLRLAERVRGLRGRRSPGPPSPAPTATGGDGR